MVMPTNIRKLPIGVQSFEKMREGNFIYVDKTAYINKLIHTGGQYFLSRPRRFGKSLFLSTLKAYWEGKHELFEGLEIEEMEKDNKDAFSPYPVFYFDFNGQNYQDRPLEKVLDFMLQEWEEIYGCEKLGSLSDRFKKIIKAAKEKTDKTAVVLVDEYDKSLLESMENEALLEHNKAVFKGFFGTLKSYDEYLRFVFITGVTKFSKVSVFSDLNQLNDISLDEEFNGICGITEGELKTSFSPEIENLAKKLGISNEECLLKLKKMYDGYHFCPNSEGIYNPFSLLNAFQKKNMDAYWFATGTPTFLVRRIKNMNFDVRQLENNEVFANQSFIMDYRTDNPSIVPILYQTGYLTITDYIDEDKLYVLGFPNEEVKFGFLNSLLPEYTPNAIFGNGNDIFALRHRIKEGDTEKIRDILTSLFASIPYTTNDAPFEHYFQSIIYIVFTLLGQYAKCEIHSAKGRADCILETNKFVYVFEFKVDKTAKEALKQIEEKGYALPFKADERKIFKIGVNFDSKERLLNDWALEEG